MRRAANVDRNQPEIVAALRAAGATVEHLHAVGGGCPDLLVGYRGANYLLEVKDGRKVASAKRLNPDQIVWHASWRGQKAVVEDIEQALRAIGAPISITQTKG
jgi:hypothetical protein